MAHKRRVVVDRAPVASSDEAEGPDEIGWRDWMLRRYARTWYWVVMLFIDIVIFLEMQRSLGTNALVAGMAAIAVGVVQLALFVRIWGKGGRLGGEHEEE